MRDLHNHIHPKVLFEPVAAITDNTPRVSEIIDMQGYDACEFVLITGTDADADATFAVTVDEGDAANLSDAAAVAAADLLGTLALAGYNFADDKECRKIGYVGGKRYVRVTVTPSANTGNFFLAGVALQACGNVQPPPNPPQ